MAHPPPLPTGQTFLEDALGAIEAWAAEIPAQRLARAIDDLNRRYRETGPAEAPYRHRVEPLPYLVARWPATHAACRAALAELARLRPDLTPKRLLDLGAGTGAASWASFEVFPTLDDGHLVERDADSVALGRRLAELGPAALRRADWRSGSLETAALPDADLVVVAYVLNELADTEARSLVARAWQAAGRALVLVEPGSRRGFDRIRAARDVLIDAGAVLAAPCPHALACPMTGGDWCHFRVRLDRGAARRRAGAALPFDDEKYSYIAAVRSVAGNAMMNRVVKAPMRRSGHVVLELCTTDGRLDRTTVTKRAGPAYRAARKAEWGHPWPPSDTVTSS